MLHHSNQVVNFSPENQDSVLGRIVAGESCLELLQNIKRFIAYGRAMAEIRAELAALRARRHRETLFSFTVGDDVEPSSGKSALELCWETLERVQFLNRRIALYQYAEERIECSGKFYYFLIRVAGIVGGSVAASKFMDDPRNDCRVRDYLAEDECADHLIESISVGTEELAQIEGARKTYSPEAKIGVESYVAWCFRLDKQGEAAECERERKSHPSPKRGSTPE